MKKILIIFITVISAFVLTRCQDEDENKPFSGVWSGEDISFTVNESSTLILDFSCECGGHATGSRCDFDYSSTIYSTKPIEILDNSFSSHSPDFLTNISGSFKNSGNATVHVSWTGIDNYCNATYSGSRTYYATHQ